MLKHQMASRISYLEHRICQLEADNARLARENGVVRRDLNCQTRFRIPASGAAQHIAHIRQLLESKS